MVTPQTIVALAPIVAPRFTNVESYSSIVLGNSTSRIDDVCEHRRRPTENVVFDGDLLVDRDIVLDFDVVSDAHAAINIDVLPKCAIASDLAVLHNMAEMPNLGAIANRNRLVDIRGFVNKIGFFHIVPLSRRCRRYDYTSHFDIHRFAVPVARLLRRL